MENLLDNECNMASYSPLTLAFVGDSVFDLLVREHLVSLCNRPVKELNSMKVSLVNCKSQAQFSSMLMSTLSDEELTIYKRGRNAQSSSVSKHSTLADYHSATGFEALFGYLYLSRKTDRIKELFALIISNIQE